jgi:uncharacterized membrane protein YfcA
VTVALAIGFGIAIGLLLGLVGGGGSILTVPILVYVIGQGVHQATATSLVIVGATALVGAVSHARAGHVALRIALTFGAAGVLGAFAGAWLNARVAGPVILLLFGLVMLLVATRMAVARKAAGSRDASTGPGPAWPVIAAGLVVGVMTGFFGVGGGFLIVPALVLLLGLPMHLAVGTSLVVIAINSAAGVVAHWEGGGVDLMLAALFVAGGAVGSTLGGRLAPQVDGARLSCGFAVLTAGVGIYLIVRNAAELILA